MSIHLAIGEPWSRAEILSSLQEASEVSGRSVSEIKSTKRDMLTVHARQAVMRDAHRKGVTHSAMARFFKCDHTTVMHGVKAAEARATANADLASGPIFTTTRNKERTQ